MVGGFVLFRYLPLHKRITAVEQAKADQRLTITKALSQSGQLGALKKQREDLDRRIGNYEAAVPAQGDVGPFLRRITNLMNEHNLDEHNIQHGTEVEAEELNCIPISMQCKGQLKQIFEFFGSLKKLERSVRIEKIKLLNDQDFGGEVTMQTDAVIYYSSDAEQG